MTPSRTTMRTQLSRVRGLGSAKSGTQHFWHQRLTALLNVPLTIAAIVIVLVALGRPYPGVVALLANPFVALILIGFVISVAVHMRLGMQVVIEDYIHNELAKIALVALNTLFAAGIALAAIYAILKIAFHA